MDFICMVLRGMLCCQRWDQGVPEGPPCGMLCTDCETGAPTGFCFGLFCRSERRRRKCKDGQEARQRQWDVEKKETRKWRTDEGDNREYLYFDGLADSKKHLTELVATCKNSDLA